MRWRSSFASVNKTPLWVLLFRTIDRVGSLRGMDEAQSRPWRNSAMMESPRNAHAPKRMRRFESRIPPWSDAAGFCHLEHRPGDASAEEERARSHQSVWQQSPLERLQRHLCKEHERYGFIP